MPNSSPRNPWWSFAVYLSFILTYLVVSFGLLGGGVLLMPEGDGGLIQYSIVDNIKKFRDGEWGAVLNRLVFYPEVETLAYTDHFFVHSIIGLPYYALTEDAIGTYTFIFIAQVIIGGVGFFLLARKMTTSTLLITIAALFYLFLPAFVETHPQINFYGFIPWVVWALISFGQRNKVRYLYLAAIAFFLQTQVGVYHQLFMLIFTPLLILAVGWYYHRRLGIMSYLNTGVILNSLVILGVLAFGLFHINAPYLSFREQHEVVRSAEEISFYAPHALLSYHLPNRTSDFWVAVGSELNLPTETNSEGKLFLGVSGNILIVVSALVIFIALFSKSFRGRVENKKALVGLVSAILIIWLLSLGTFLKSPVLDGTPLPYYLLHSLHPVFGAIRATGRMVVILALPLALLIIYWGTHFQSRKHIVAQVLLVALCAGVLIDVVKIRQPQSAPELPIEAYKNLETLPGNTLLQLPSGYHCNELNVTTECNPIEDDPYMFLHIYHQKHDIAGYSGFIPEETTKTMIQIEMLSASPTELNDYLISIPVDLILIDYKRIPEELRGNFDSFLFMPDYISSHIEEEIVILQRTN